MSKFEEKLKEGTKDIRLSATKKKELRESIEAYMRMHPIRGMAGEGTPIPSPFFIPVFWKKTVPAIALFLVVVFGGVSSFAEAALPGDFLYPVKVGFNEEVVRVLSFNDDSKAQWEVKRIERRVEEVARLKASGELDDEEKTDQVTERIEEYAERAEALADRLAEKQKIAAALDVRADLEAQLEGRDEVLYPQTVAMLDASRSGDLSTMSLMAVESDNAATAETFEAVADAVDAAPTLMEKEVGEEYKEAAERQQKKAIEVAQEIRTEMERTKVDARLERHFDRRIISPLGEMEMRISEAEALLGEEKFAESFEVFKETHKSLNRLRASLQSGNWKIGGETSMETRAPDSEFPDVPDGNEEEIDEEASDDTGETPTSADDERGTLPFEDEGTGEEPIRIDDGVVEGRIPVSSDLVRVCPDEWIVNRMPSIVGDITPRDYLIYNGRRVELAVVDLDWVRENCEVEPVEVF